MIEFDSYWNLYYYFELNLYADSFDIPYLKDYFDHKFV